MSVVGQLEAVWSAADTEPLEKRAQIFGLLRQQPDGGVDAAASCLERATERLLATYVSQYLSRVPGEREAKIRAAEGLRRSPHACGAASRLVRWLPWELLDGFLQDYLALPDPSSLELRDPWADLASVAFVIAQEHPERVRPLADRIDDSLILERLVLGAPAAEVDALVERWRTDGDVEHLETVAQARTEHSRRQLLSLRECFTVTDDPDDPCYAGVWERLVHQSGLLPDTGRTAGYQPAHHGYVVERGRSPHRLGGEPVGEVPLCEWCDAPVAPLLHLSAAALPEHGLTADPVFLWFTCECLDAEVLTTRQTDAGHLGYGLATGKADPSAPALPTEWALELEPSPGRYDPSEAHQGFSQHQVGGLPGWILDSEPHPGCPECGTSMPYLATVAGGLTPLGEMPFRGNVYCFWCDPCRVGTVLLQYSDW